MSVVVLVVVAAAACGDSTYETRNQNNKVQLVQSQYILLRDVVVGFGFHFLRAGTSTTTTGQPDHGGNQKTSSGNGCRKGQGCNPGFQTALIGVVVGIVVVVLVLVVAVLVRDASTTSN